MKCPICGNDNGCYMDHGKDPHECWCHDVEFPTMKTNYGTCICKDCVIKMKKEELRKEIIEVEKQFMLDALTMGGKGWAKHFLVDGTMVSSKHEPNIVGRDKIETVMTPPFANGVKLTWEPKLIEFSDDYSLCYSQGEYVREFEGKKDIGKYLTIFRRTENGWMVELDIGN